MPDVVTFDPINLRIVEIDGGALNVLQWREIYSEWKDWVLANPQRQGFPQAFRVVGGDPISDTENLGSTFFLLEPWKFRPAELDHSLVVEGNLFTDPAGGNPFVPTLGDFTVLIAQKVSTLVEQVAGGVLNPEDVWGAPELGNTEVDTMGGLLKKVDNTTVATDGKVDVLDTKIDAVQTTVDGIDTQLDDVQTTVETIDDKCDTIILGIANIDQKLDNLEITAGPGGGADCTLEPVVIPSIYVGHKGDTYEFPVYRGDDLISDLELETATGLQVRFDNEDDPAGSILVTAGVTTSGPNVVYTTTVGDLVFESTGKWVAQASGIAASGEPFKSQKLRVLVETPVQ